MEKKFVAEKSKIAKDILSLPGVIGIGWGFKHKEGKNTGANAVRVYVREKLNTADLKGKGIPEFVTLSGGEKVPTDVVETGSIHFTAFFGRYRPAKPGAVISHFNGDYPGTFGALVTDLTDNSSVILAASHVLANMNTANLGDNILQPGIQNGGINPNDAIATLKRYIPLDFTQNANNYVDVGLAAPKSKQLVSATPLDTRVKPTRQGAIGVLFAAGDAVTLVNPIQRVMTDLNISLPKTAAAAPGQSVHLVGAASGYFATTVADIHVDILMVGPDGYDIWFRDQILLPSDGLNAEGGDSGAVVYTTYNV